MNDMNDAPTNPEPPVLIGQSGPLDGQRWVIDETKTIGRDPACDIIIPSRQVSRFHARIIPGEDGITLEDLLSKNGTYCNGRILEDPIILQDGDILQIALTQEFAYLSSESTMPLSFIPKGDILETEIIKRMMIEKRSRRTWVNQMEILPSLSNQQFHLLNCLYEHEGKVVSREELIVATWGEDESLGVSEQALDALVRRLRDRIAAVDPSHKYIITVRGHGLRLENPPLQAE